MVVVAIVVVVDPTSDVVVVAMVVAVDPTSDLVVVVAAIYVLCQRRQMGAVEPQSTRAVPSPVVAVSVYSVRQLGEIAVVMQSPVSVYETMVVVLSHSQPPGPDVSLLVYRSHCMAAHVTGYRHPGLQGVCWSWLSLNLNLLDLHRFAVLHLRALV